MVSGKIRRNSGRVYPKCNVPQKVLDEEGIVVDLYWDDWVDHRDGFRDKSRIAYEKGKRALKRLRSRN